jgi:hypothetical protein
MLPLQVITMNNDLKYYSILTGDLFVQNVYKGGLIRSFVAPKYTKANLRIRPAAPKLSRFFERDEVEQSLAPYRGLDGFPFLPTPLASIDSETQKYFTKHNRVQPDGKSVHPWQVYLWSRKVANSGDAVKVLASKTGVGSWILVPMTPAELKQLPTAILAQKAAMRAKREANDAEHRAQENLATERALQMTAGLSQPPKPSAPEPRVDTPRHQRTAPRSQRTSVSGDIKKSPASSRRGSAASSTFSKV